jgi:hypothetical protein
MGDSRQGQPECPEQLMHVTEATKAIKTLPTHRPPLVLATKVFPPRLPAGLIDRPRLASFAAQTATKRLTVIKAPAGFGKTSLALTWLNALATSTPATSITSRTLCGKPVATSAPP